ncbi:hypothetical protein BJ165DRAFT_128164 [Panaeolus papilionaceus]|nr:hypothetical protein BJ165DRAFT_128164 [Panaeolus papilionaceus]
MLMGVSVLIQGVYALVLFFGFFRHNLPHTHHFHCVNGLPSRTMVPGLGACSASKTISRDEIHPFLCDLGCVANHGRIELQVV